MNISRLFRGASQPRSASHGMEKITLNQPTEYLEVEANFDLAHGCTIVIDAVADVVADVVVDGVVDAVVDGGADAVVDGGADALADAGADAIADAGANSGLSPGTISKLKTLGLLLGGAVMGEIVSEATQAIKNAAAGGHPPTSADYWNSLYSTMVAQYPCNTGSNTACPTNVRNAQEAMVGTFAINLGANGAAAAAAAFEKTWPADSQSQLKNTLVTMSQSSGIPSMLQYLATYTNPGASGAALVIATANVLMTVAGFEYTD